MTAYTHILLDAEANAYAAATYAEANAYAGLVPPRREAVAVIAAPSPESWMRNTADTIEAMVADRLVMDLAEMRTLLAGLRIVTQQMFPPVADATVVRIGRQT